MDVFNKFTIQKGQTLVEVALAIAAATVIITALLTTMLSSMNGAENSQTQNEATQYSQEAMEIMRSISGNYSNNSTLCLAGGSTTPDSGPGCNPNNPTPNINGKYFRWVLLEKNNVNCGGITQITVTTSWKDSKCPKSPPKDQFCKQSQLISCISNL